MHTQPGRVGPTRALTRAALIVFLLIYSAVTLFPFYVMFIRTFVGTRDSTDLHLWIPPGEEVSLDADIGNLSTFYNLSLRQLKEDLGIEGYGRPSTTLRELTDPPYNVPVERIERYSAGFGTYSGWLTLLSTRQLLLGTTTFWQALGRSLLITVGSLVGINTLSIMTGCGLAGLRRRYQMFFYNLYLLEMVIPAMLVIVPQFMLIQYLQGLVPGSDKPGSIRWVVQMLSLILIYIKGGAFSTMVFTSAIGAIPSEIEESAYMDGANRWQYIYHILLPLLRVPISTMTVIMLPDFWNRFVEPYIYLDLANTAVLPMIQNLAGKYSTNFQVIFTGIFVSILPLLIVYLAFRRFFIRGVMAGAVKG